jgi:hypothetical protein
LAPLGDEYPFHDRLFTGVGANDPLADEWDQFILVYYPNRHNFFAIWRKNSDR